MPASTAIPSQALWGEDRPDSLIPPVAEPPYFDTTLDAWIFSRYADIVAALRSPSLIPASATKTKAQEQQDEEQHQKTRTEALAALSASSLRLWKQQLARHSHQLVQSLPVDRPVDLIGEYARPLCLSLASTITGIQHSDPRKLCEHARAVSAFAADPYNSALKTPAKSASAELHPFFPSGPETLRSSGFVALTQTMPALLGNTWFALLQHPEEWRSLHLNPEWMEQAIEELMRYSGFTRILARMAIADTSINGTTIQKDQRIVLRLIAANRDPESFSRPNDIDLNRRGAAHLSFGTGPHACVAAGLLRMIAVTISAPLLSHFATAQLARNVEWKGGATFLTPKFLWVHLYR
jgi:cytochrome P450